MSNNDHEQDDDDDAAVLSQLMQALAAGARAVQGIPAADDFQRSFPEFTQVNFPQLKRRCCKRLIDAETLPVKRRTMKTHKDTDNFLSCHGRR
jgi:hypothetical protein